MLPTKTWWRQSTGEAIAGELKGKTLNELQSVQTTLQEWIKLYPATKIMQLDNNFTAEYDNTYKYEDGQSKSPLTGTDSLSWKNKSWVVGIKSNGNNKVIDWNELKQKHLIQTKVGNTNAFVILAKDDKSFFAYENPLGNDVSLTDDTVLISNKKYKVNGIGIDTTINLKPLKAYQEFWHSWQTFQPNTSK